MITHFNGKPLTSIRVCLAGNPNCGKTTLFNALTGLNYKVANYPGVTVEKKSGTLQISSLRTTVQLVDLPGIYSLSSTSLDEKIATQYLTGELPTEPPPDIIVAVVDAANIERNLYLVTQLIDCGIPMIIALNMTDLAEKRGIRVYDELLSRGLDVPVVPLIAKSGSGINELEAALCSILHSGEISKKSFAWLPPDSLFLEKAKLIGTAYQKTHRSAEVTAPLIGCSLISDSFSSPSPEISHAVTEARDILNGAGVDPYTYEATERYHWIQDILKTSCSIQDNASVHLARRIDSLLTHQLWGSLIFVLIMGIIFQSIFMWSQIPMDLIDQSVGWLSETIAALLPEGQIKSLVVDGVIAGVGSVVIFIPQIAVLFFFLGLLEDSGYLSRAAFLMDGLMRRVGLQGRSFIPMLSSFACAIPGIMSTRTIPSWADRLATILVAPLMSCSARLPVYAVLIAAFIPDTYFFGVVSIQGLTLLSMYLLGVVGAGVVAWILKKTLLRREPAFFVMELPPFRRPSLLLVLRDVVDRIKIFLQSAGTVILACSIILWFLASYPQTDAGESPDLRMSYAGQAGVLIEPVIKPLGFNWEMGIGLIASFAAREVFVSSLATIYNIQDDDESSSTLIEALKARAIRGEFSTATALSLMVFYVFACQCMSTLAVTKRETGSWRWVGFMFAYMTGLAYVASLITYTIAR